MQYKWQLWLGCILVFTGSLVLLNRDGSIRPDPAASPTVHSQRTVPEHHATTDRPQRRLTSLNFRQNNINSPQAPTIIGGEVAPPGAWPWMAALVYASSRDAAQGQFCGGTLIHAEWILSAAHCTYDLSGRPRQPAEIEVVVGRHELSGTDGQRVAVDRLLRHPAYTGNSFDNDVALLHLAAPVDISPLPLLQPQHRVYESSGTPVMVLGWGVTDAGHDSDVLRQVEVPLVDLKTCRQSYGIFNEKVTENMLCAGLKDGGKDSCQGDSGGPMLVFDLDHHMWRQLGIVSWGEGCAEPNYYGVYTRVSHYIDWIYSQIPMPGTPLLTPTFASPTPVTPTPVTPTSTPTPLAIHSPTLTPTKEATATPQLSVTATSTLIPTAPATPLPTTSATADGLLSPTPVGTPPVARMNYTLYLPLVTTSRFLALQNGDFESRPHHGWSEFSLQQQSLIVHASIVAASARSGTYLAQLGVEQSEIAYVQQIVTVPPDAPVLEFWVKIESVDDCGYDFGGIVVEDQVVTQFDLCRSSATADWQRREVDLRTYSSMDVSLEIRAETDGFLNSTLLVDDITFIAVTAAQNDDTHVEHATSAATSGSHSVTQVSPEAPLWVKQEPGSTRQR